MDSERPKSPGSSQKGISIDELIKMGLSPHKYGTRPADKSRLTDPSQSTRKDNMIDVKKSRNSLKQSSINELIEMGLPPKRYNMQKTALERSKDGLFSKENVVSELTKEPGVVYKLENNNNGRLFGHKLYDPYSFLDKMAMPFDVPRPPDGDSKKKVPNSAGVHLINEPPDGRKRPMPHCKACTDFKTWMELTANPRRNMSRKEREEKECPLDSQLLGNNTWSFLHTMAAYYPENPSAEQQHKMKTFIKLLSDFYPCHKCAANLREDLKTFKPDTTSNVSLSRWFCELHNKVNVRLGKPEFDCSKVLERWRDGWADGTCD